MVITHLDQVSDSPVHAGIWNYPTGLEHWPQYSMSSGTRAAHTGAQESAHVVTARCAAGNVRCAVSPQTCPRATMNSVEESMSVSAAQQWTGAWSRIQVAGGKQEQRRWERAARRAAQIIEPRWPEGYSAGPFSHAVFLVASAIFLLLPDTDPDDVSVADLIDLLATKPEQAWVGDRLTDALSARGQTDTDLGRRLALLRAAPSVAEWQSSGGPDPLTLPSEWAPDFRERLAGVVEWTAAALKLSHGAAVS
jgi:hypothetical protein